MDPAVHPRLRTTPSSGNLTTQAESRERTTLDNPAPKPGDESRPHRQRHLITNDHNQPNGSVDRG